MRIKLIALATCFMVLPALAQTTLRGTPDETFTYLSHDEIAKGLMKTWPGKTYSSVFGSDHEYFFVEFVKRQDHETGRKSYKFDTHGASSLIVARGAKAPR